MPLFKHQVDFIKRNPNKTALIWSCGLGKSRAALEWAMKWEREQHGEFIQHPLLIICPKALKTNWHMEVAKADCPFMPMILTKEEFRKFAKELPPVSQIIVDEVHNGFLTPNFKSQMSKMLRGYLKTHKVRRLLLLSATVYSSSPWNIFNLAYYCDQGWNWQHFNIEFFNQVRMGMRIVPVAKKGAEKILAARVKTFCDVVNIYDVMDVPLQHHADPEYFSLTPSQKAAIKAYYDPLPIVRYTKQHEIEQGFVKLDLGEATGHFANDKTDRIISLVEENPKIAIVCRYNAQIDELAKVLADRKHYIIRGDTKDRDTITREAEAAERAVVLIQADCAEGYELPSFPICVFASQSYSYVKWEQMCGRFLRMNKPSRTTFLYLLTEGESVDRGVYEAVKRKEDFRIELFAKKNS